MKDIDFDELDRAVSSLMSTAPSDEPETTATTRVVTLEENTMPSNVDEPQPESVADETPSVLNLDAPTVSSESDLLQTQEPEPAIVTAQPEVPSITVPSRGRFMDVIRPVVREAKKVAPSSSVARRGTVLRPMSTSMQASEFTPAPDVNVEQAGASALQRYDPSAIETAFIEASMDGTPAFEEALSGIVGDTAPQSSPFLPDTKVEKRPLGRPADSAPVVDLAAEFAESLAEPTVESFDTTEDSISPNKDAQLPEQPLPAELGSELLSIETSTDNLPPETQPEIAPEVEQPTVSLPEPTPTPTRAMEITSIPQQYKVRPQQNEEAPVGAIYDTQPLAHPAEKKPGWVWIAAILAIIALGTGAGAAVYYLGLL